MSPQERRLNALIAIVIVLVLWMLFWPAPARAQSLKRDLVTASLQAGDIITTNKVISQGGREANPLMMPFAGGPKKLVAAKAVYTAFIIHSAHATSKQHPKLAKWLWLGGNLYQGYIVYHNVRQMRGMR